MPKQKQGRRCAVSICTNYANKPGRNDLSYFRFPKDDKIRNEWIMKCKRNDKFNPVTSRISSYHFEKNKFLRDLKCELTGYYSNRQLVPQSIPTLKLNPPATSPCSENSNARQIRMKKKIDSENRREILNLSLGPTQFEECEERNIRSK